MNHAIFGLIGRGKSTLGLHHFERQPGGRVWWDPNGDQRVPSWAVEADADSDRFALENALRKGMAVIFHAVRRGEFLGDDEARKQVLWLLHKCVKHKSALFVDECHKVYPQGRPMAELEDAGRRARHLEITVAMMSTEIQATDKSVMQMGALVELFRLGFSGPWLSRYKIPQGAIDALETLPDHSYITIPPGDPQNWSGPHQISASRLSRLTG